MGVIHLDKNGKIIEDISKVEFNPEITKQVITIIANINIQGGNT